MKFSISVIVAMVCIFGFSSLALAQANAEKSGSDKETKVEKAVDSKKTEKADEKADSQKKDAEKQNSNAAESQKSKDVKKGPFETEEYESIDVELDVKSDPVADNIFLVFNYVTIIALVVMVISVSLWVKKNRDKKAKKANKSGKKKAKSKSKSEELTEEKDEEESDDKEPDEESNDSDEDKKDSD